MNISEKKQVKCSFCDHVEMTDKTAYICEDCVKTMGVKYCPGCGKKIEDNEKDIYMEHTRRWHTNCHSVFSISKTQSTDTFGPSNNKSKRYIVSSEPYLYQDLEKVSKSLRDTQNPYNAMDISKKLSMDTDYQKKLINTNKAAIESYKTVVNCLYQREILHTVTDDRTHDTYRNVISGYQLIRYLLDSHRCTTEDEVYYPSSHSFPFYRRSCSVNN